jgi:hypothetical protein
VQETGRGDMKRVAPAPSMSYLRDPGDGLKKTASSAASSSVSPAGACATLAESALRAEEPLTVVQRAVGGEVAGGSAVFKKGKGCVEKVAEVIPKPKVVPGDEKGFRVTTGGNNDEMAAAASSSAAASSLSSPGRSFIKLFDDVRVSMVDKKVEQEVSVEQSVKAFRREEAVSDAMCVMATTSSSLWSSEVGTSMLFDIFEELRDLLEDACEEKWLGAVQRAIGRFDGTPLSRFAFEERRAIQRVAGQGCDVGVMTYSKLLGFLRKANRPLWETHKEVDGWSQRFCA